MSAAWMLAAATPEISIVLAAALLAVRLLSSSSAALRHRILAAAVVCAAFVPLAERVAPRWRGAPAPSAVADEAGIPADAGHAASTAGTAAPVACSHEPAPPRRSRIGTLLLWLWLAGAAAGLCVLGAGLLRLAWLASRARPVADARWNAIRS